jgi:hypothetical protein
MDESRRGKFEWQEGDVKFEIPQCYNCAYNEGITCLKFGSKPRQYAKNEQNCPEKVIDKNY